MNAVRGYHRIEKARRSELTDAVLAKTTAKGVGVAIHPDGTSTECQASKLTPSKMLRIGLVRHGQPRCTIAVTAPIFLRHHTLERMPDNCRIWI